MPSHWGYLPPGSIGGGEGNRGGEAIGKVNGVVYDRFGGFEGFRLLTEKGPGRAYRGHEAEIEALARYAWAEHVVITVLTDTNKPDVPVSIILRRAPPQSRRWDA